MNVEQRYDIIFELINQGKKPDEIHTALAGNHKRKNKDEFRGYESERIAEGRLRKLYIVELITKYPKYSPEDYKGWDLRVSFNKWELTKFLERTPSIMHCQAQVKSSVKGVEEFRSRFGDTRGESKIKLAENKVVILNARTEEEEFYDNFFQQVKFIDTLHQEND